MLTRLGVKGFKSLEDVTVGLARLSVLFGPNAAGKSSLLEAVRLLSSIATERTLRDAFAPLGWGCPVEVLTASEETTCASDGRSHADLTLETDIAPGWATKGRTRRASLRYRITVRADLSGGALRVADEYLTRLSRAERPKGIPRLERADDRLMVRRRVEGGRPWQEPLGLVFPLVFDPRLTGDLFPAFDEMREELAKWRFYDLLARTAMRQPRLPRKVTDIGRFGEDLVPFLYRLKTDPDHGDAFASVGKLLHRAIPAVQGIDVSLDDDSGTADLRVLRDGVSLSSRVISDGTLKMLALCAIAANPWPGTVAVFDEPEAGVHPRRIEVVADLLASMALSGSRQVIVATHSPTLVAAMLHKQQSKPRLVQVMACQRKDRATLVRPFESPPPLLADREIRTILASETEDGTIE